ncbi:papain fold toxin domain-containing protein [Microcoleus sp. D2_18a_B4]|uniref:papain fold toxin domain-containing protein n=1 Tax=Microcoleus sp. D2_18a_B4 TaxID=3055329 RepID=UPI002FD2B57C
MSNFSNLEIYQEIKKIVRQFKILECDRCAVAVMEWLEQQGIQGKILRLRTRYQEEDYIISERLERLGVEESITVNGKHYGVEVAGLVFDNLSTDGMLREEWVKDFHCQSEEFVVEELESL